MSVLTPYHFTIAPVSSRKGAARSRIARYSPAAARARASTSNGSPVAIAERHFSRMFARSSG